MNKQQWLIHKRQNAFQSILLVLTLTSLASLLAYILAGSWLVWLVIFIIVLAYFFNPLLSPEIVLRLYKGKLIHPSEAPQLYHMTQELAKRAQLPSAPQLYYIPSNVMNAFTTGHKHNSIIALSDGILRRLDQYELAGVIAHEISHLKHDDLRVMAFADFTARLTHFFSLFGQVLTIILLPFVILGFISINWLAVLLLLGAPILGALLQLALSRNREYDADLGAVELLGNPMYLAQALKKLENIQGNWISKVFWPHSYNSEPSILRTHPPTVERIERLQALMDQPLRQFPNTVILNQSSPPLIYLSSSPLRARHNYISGIWY